CRRAARIRDADRRRDPRPAQRQAALSPRFGRAGGQEHRRAEDRPRRAEEAVARYGWRAGAAAGRLRKARDLTEAPGASFARRGRPVRTAFLFVPVLPVTTVNQL